MLAEWRHFRCVELCQSYSVGNVHAKRDETWCSSVRGSLALFVKFGRENEPSCGRP